MKLFCCPVCPKKFTRKVGRDRHVRESHNEVKKIPCLFWGVVLLKRFYNSVWVLAEVIRDTWLPLNWLSVVTSVFSRLLLSCMTTCIALYRIVVRRKDQTVVRSFWSFMFFYGDTSENSDDYPICPHLLHSVIQSLVTWILSWTPLVRLILCWAFPVNDFACSKTVFWSSILWYGTDRVREHDFWFGRIMRFFVWLSKYACLTLSSENSQEIIDSKRDIETKRFWIGWKNFSLRNFLIFHVTWVLLGFFLSVFCNNSSKQNFK